jgi:hypothetical protein
MTLNQVIKRLKTVIAANTFINSIYVGEVSEWGELPNVVYSNALIVIGDVTPQGAEYEVAFTVYFSDLLEDGADNRVNIFSDTLQIAQDIAADLNEEEANDFIFNLTKPITFYDDVRGTDNTDRVAGVIMDFSLRARYINKCSIDHEERKRITIITDTGLEILTEDGEYIQNEAAQ